MKRISIIIQECIKFFLFFIIFFVWLKYTLTSRTFAIILSIALSFLFQVITLLIGNKQKVKKHIKFCEEQDAENMFLSLTTNSQPLEFFEQLFKSRHKEVIKMQDHIIINDHHKEKTTIVPFLKIKELETDDLINIAKQHTNCSKIIIICGKCSKNCIDYLKYLEKNIVILNKYETYTLIYKEYEFFPTISPKAAKSTSFSLKRFYESIFNKSKTKSFLFAGLFLLFSSTYLPNAVYYKITATVLFVCAILCLLQKDKTSSKKELV